MIAVRTRYAVTICVALVLVAVVLSGCGTPKPVVKSVMPAQGLAGTGVKLTGTAFGKTQGKSVVTIGKEKADVVSWADTAITAKVPRALTEGSYPVAVTTSGGASNKSNYKVMATYTGSTPLPAMQNYLRSNGIDTAGYTFGVVTTSTANPNWKLDKASKSGQPTYYFLFNKITNGWIIVDAGTAFSADQLKTDGAPSDIKPPT